MKNTPIDYTLTLSAPKAHRITVTCCVAEPDPAGQRFALPAWIPGSYLIRDFARHIIAIRAETNGTPVPLTKTDKHTWQAPALAPGHSLQLSYDIYAWDLSVRGAHVDETHAFFNGTSVFLRVIGQEDTPCRIRLTRPQGKAFAPWRVATALEPVSGEAGGAKRHGFGVYRAANYDELIDHPVEMGTFTLASFTACGIPHEVAITGRHDCDLKRLTADLQRICEWQIRFFGEPAPIKHYLFLVMAVGDGYGGLEHRASTALLCSRNDLPYPGMPAMTEGYRTFLGLCSHEYFHTWNVKRIQPAAFVPYDLDRENYTRLLWAFEGITSYYDDLALLRSGVIPLKDWLELLAKTISNVQRTPGRQRQSVADSSFDAWSKFYRPDDNTPNAVVSYYAKGALVALTLDLTLRQKTGNRVSLDDLMRALWTRYGQTRLGVGEDDIRLLAEALSGLKLRSFFSDFVDGTRELPLKKRLADQSIRLDWTPAKTPSLGAKTVSEGDAIKLAHVFDEGPAQAAGLAASDLLIAADGLRVTQARLEALLSRRKAGDKVCFHAFRRDQLMTFEVELAAPDTSTAALTAKPGISGSDWPYR